MFQTTNQCCRVLLRRISDCQFHTTGEFQDSTGGLKLSTDGISNGK